MTLLRRSSYPSERSGAIPLDLAFRDGPVSTVLGGPQLPLADLDAQRRRRHPESGCRLNEREHLLPELVAVETPRARVAADMDVETVRTGIRDLLVGLFQTDVLTPDAASRRETFGLVFEVVRHLVPLRAVFHIQNVRAIAYVVNRVNA